MGRPLFALVIIASLANTPTEVSADLGKCMKAALNATQDSLAYSFTLLGRITHRPVETRDALGRRDGSSSVVTLLGSPPLLGPAYHHLMRRPYAGITRRLTGSAQELRPWLVSSGLGLAGSIYLASLREESKVKKDLEARQEYFSLPENQKKAQEEIAEDLRYLVFQVAMENSSAEDLPQVMKQALDYRDLLIQFYTLDAPLIMNMNAEKKRDYLHGHSSQKGLLIFKPQTQLLNQGLSALNAGAKPGQEPYFVPPHAEENFEKNKLELIDQADSIAIENLLEQNLIVAAYKNPDVFQAMRSDPVYQAALQSFESEEFKSFRDEVEQNIRRRDGSDTKTTLRLVQEFSLWRAQEAKARALGVIPLNYDQYGNPYADTLEDIRTELLQRSLKR